MGDEIPVNEAEAAKMLGASLWTVRGLVASGCLPAIKYNAKTVRFLPSDIRKLIDERRTVRGAS